MMYSRLGNDPRAETIRNQEEDRRAETTNNRGLERGLGAEMMKRHSLERDLEVEMILNLIESRIILIYGRTQILKIRKKTKVSSESALIQRLLHQDRNQKLCPINCANFRNHRNL